MEFVAVKEDELRRACLWAAAFEHVLAMRCSLGRSGYGLPDANDSVMARSWADACVAAARPSEREVDFAKYPIELRESNDGSGWIIASCPTLEGCVTQGRTRDEATANIREAIRLCLDDDEAATCR